MLDQVIIADTSCLIGLERIGQLELLSQIYDSISITPEVQNEYNERLPEWINVKPVKDAQKQYILELEVDKGEASAIALALEETDSLLIIDEKRGRRVAKRLGISIIGILGVLVKAKEMGITNKILPSIEKLEVTGFRIAKELKIKILQRVGELNL